LNPVLVRPSGRFPGKYDVADGLRRTSAARDTGRTPLPCLVKDLTAEDLLAILIQADALRPETMPAEYARQVRKIIEAHPGVGLPEISARILHKNPQWVRETLGLLNLRKDFQLAVDRGDMPLGWAYELARVPPKFQPQFFDAARTMTVAGFRPLVQAFLKQFHEAIRQGKLDALFTTDCKPVPHGRPWEQIIAQHGKLECAALILVAEQCRTLTDAWRAALAWALHLDRESVEAQRQAVLNRARQPGNEPPGPGTLACCPVSVVCFHSSPLRYYPMSENHPHPENTLVPISPEQLPSTQIGSDDQFAELARSSDYLPRLQLYTKGKVVNRKLVGPGNYGIPVNDEEVDDLGDVVHLIPLARRPKAIDMTDSEAVIVSYNPDSDEFKRIAATSLEKESHCTHFECGCRSRPLGHLKETSTATTRG
jgi:hypothetical protein